MLNDVVCRACGHAAVLLQLADLALQREVGLPPSIAIVSTVIMIIVIMIIISSSSSSSSGGGSGGGGDGSRSSSSSSSWCPTSRCCP